MWRYVVAGGLVTLTLITLTTFQPTEVQQIAGTVPRVLDGTLSTELPAASLLGKQQEASRRQAELLQQLHEKLLATDDAATGPSSSASRLTSRANGGGAVAAASPLTEAGERAAAEAAAAHEAASAASVAAAEAKALAGCSEADVPILSLLRRPCRTACTATGAARDGG